MSNALHTTKIDADRGKLYVGSDPEKGMIFK
jgi:hypothetical protein